MLTLKKHSFFARYLLLACVGLFLLNTPFMVRPEVSRGDHGMTYSIDHGHSHLYLSFSGGKKTSQGGGAGKKYDEGLELVIPVVNIRKQAVRIFLDQNILYPGWISSIGSHSPPVTSSVA